MYYAPAAAATLYTIATLNCTATFQCALLRSIARCYVANAVCVASLLR
jgi:hypothetical protein